jgi:hypothetical protein
MPRPTHCANIALMRTPLTVLAELFDRLGRYEPAATINEFAADTLTRTGFSEITTATRTSARSSATRPTNRSPARAS